MTSFMERSSLKCFDVPVAECHSGQVVPGAPGAIARAGTGRRRSHLGSGCLTAATGDDSDCNSCCHTVAMLCHALCVCCLFTRWASRHQHDGDGGDLFYVCLLSVHGI